MHGRPPQASDLTPFVQDIMSQVQGLTGNSSTDVLLRIFYYDCKPFGKTIKGPDGKKQDFSSTAIYRGISNFQNDLKLYPQLALRLGELAFNGWVIDANHPGKLPRPDFRQKSIDMKIGLDIASMATKKTVDKIVLVTGDSDFVSPMKLARREGLLVYLQIMEQKQIMMELKEHADFVLR